MVSVLLFVPIVTNVGCLVPVIWGRVVFFNPEAEIYIKFDKFKGSFNSREVFCVVRRIAHDIEFSNGRATRRLWNYGKNVLWGTAFNL